MYSAAFIWDPGVYDSEFHRLNAIIDDVAKSLPGFLGVDSWQAVDGHRKNATYHRESLDTLQTFAAHPAHQDAKRQVLAMVQGLPHRHLTGAAILWRQCVCTYHTQ